MLLPLIRQSGILLKRYKRFLADIQLDNGQTLTVHCPNSGSMLGCSQPGSPVILSYAGGSTRKYAWTLEMVQHQGTWIGVHTGRTNAIVREGLENGVIREFGAISAITPEVVVSGKSRLDFLLETAQGKIYLEVKNCSLAEDATAMFPDAVTARGTKHLHELARLVEAGYGAAVLFCIQRSDAVRFRPASSIDPVYAQTVSWAQERGVQFLAYQAEVTTKSVTLARKIPVFIPSSSQLLENSHE